MSNTKQILTALLFVFGAVTYSQAQNLCLGNDTTVCAGSPVTIENCLGTINNNNGLVLNNPTTVSLSDDQWSGLIPIGFNFSFYGNTYNQCVIGSNCILSFDQSDANGYCPWGLTGIGPLPNAGFAAATNTIMPCYQDINPSAWTSPNGAIVYQTLGTAPNRMFVVLWKDINFFSCTSVCNYLSCIIYESSNIIEVHIGDKPLCTSWNGGLGIQGTENPPGTVAHITPGRNNTQWSANQEGKRWTPTSPTNTTNYTISTIPYVLITSSGTNFQWENTLGQVFPYNNGTLNIPQVPPGGPTGYFLSGSACSASLGSVSDTSWITGVTSSVTASGTDDICSTSQGTVTATPTGGQPPYTFNWPGLGNNPNQTVNGVPAGTYTVIMTDALGCTSQANVTIGDTPATFTGSSTLVSCSGGSDGTATATMTPLLGTVTYQWDDPMMQTTQTATGLSAGQYTCTITSSIGCSGTVVVDVNEIPPLTGSIIDQSDVTCNSGNDGMIEVSASLGTAPYSYAWSNSTSTASIADDLYAGNHSVTITDANNCSITLNGVINEPPALDITFITPNTQICPEDDITLDVTGTGGSSPYTFTWFENGTQIGTGSQITVDPLNTNTEYCVQLSEACGSPIDEECTIIYFPTPIEPNATPNFAELCVPNTFEFTNTSANGGEIATTVWDFGTQQYYMLENGNDSISMFFDDIGTYDLVMTTTSIYGCVYQDTIESIIEVLPTPTARFFFSSNPTTIFETSVFMQDASSSDVVYWDWYSPYSNPTQSSLVSPTFTFPDGEPGEYPITLTVETELGCTDTVTMTLSVVEDILFFAPNSFTPDGDEFNQVWKPEVTGIDIYDYDLFIFNRWGELIWESHDPSVGWDGTYNGKRVQDGMYVWRARVSTPYNDDKHEFSGSINLIR